MRRCPREYPKVRMCGRIGPAFPHARDGVLFRAPFEPRENP